MILNYISLPVFIISLAVGLFVVYILGPEEKIIFVYPTPENVESVLYKDKADQCFQFNSVEIECPSDKSKIHETPVQA